MVWHIVTELNNFLVNRFNLRCIMVVTLKLFFYTTKKQVEFLLYFGIFIFTRDKITISIIHCKQSFTLYKTSRGEK